MRKAAGGSVGLRLCVTAGLVWRVCKQALDWWAYRGMEGGNEQAGPTCNQTGFVWMIKTDPLLIRLREQGIKTNPLLIRLREQRRQGDFEKIKKAALLKKKS